MARRRGWGGNPPHSDEEAGQRIIAAAVDLVAETGSAVSLADVANSLGVIRQTVYRYFPTADALMRAVAIASVDGFLDRLTEHVHGIHDPADALTEGTLYTLDAVVRSPHLGAVLSSSSTHSREMTSEEARAFGMRMIERFDVDWKRYGYDEASLRELVEFTLRIMLSFIVAPNDPDRSPDDLRRFLRRWLGEAVAAQKKRGL
ncbi:TetR/AcrR family transcriptional regulator [Mycolicibacter kumamotonensis]|jgi:AcrR family transcriptional regulator|uniref:TetR family transcriptional regulator n=1 Tax=Mycolicibacter kumamotonensis TaxID=354243 RepID=A0A1B8SJE1_9MYCO|nr:TetR/AcrR family transcriptional regulator [Mycolicibacter kumamotonensis]NDJ89389.1 TetR/AcrR family transcriptional regulator [Mycolicibacter kumamotonensis]OBY32839.1 TetR family transcriptional regulator [Mycolicibacter kumamotonensis]ORA77847.1 TetR family transcriptional regulator [Mycolicibacter kumamotonensis]